MNEQETAIQENAFPLEDMHAWRRRSVRELLRGAAVLGLPALIVGLLLVRQTWLIPVYVSFYVGFVLLAFWRRSPYTLQVAVIMALVYGLGVAALFEDGLSGDGRVFLLAISVIAVLFLGLRPGIYTLVLSGLTLAAFGWIYASGRLVIPEEQGYSADGMAWLSGTVVFILVGTAVLISQNYVLPRLTQALDRSRKLTQELQIYQITLQQRVEERTARLQHRAQQFQAVAEVGRAVTGVRDLDSLTAEAVRQVSQRFGSPATAIYLLDETKTWLILQAAFPREGDPTGAERDQRLQVGELGAVGRAAANRQPCVIPAADGREGRQEIALPLQVGGQLVGILSLQTISQETSVAEDVGILSVMADQLALAVENVRLFTETQQALQRVSHYREQATRDAWERTLLHRGGRLTFLYDQVATRPVPADEALVLLGDGKQPQDVTVRSLPDGRFVLIAPIKVNERSIGSLAFESRQAWENDKIALVEAAVHQVSQALENARLMEDIQYRASREQMTAQITSRMRESLDVDTVLRTAVQEMRNALGLAEAEVWIKPGKSK